MSPTRAYRIAAPLAALFIVGTVLQPFLPDTLQPVMIALRLLLIPGFIALFMFTSSECILFAAIAFLFFFIQYINGAGFDGHALLIMLSTLASLPFFKAGAQLGALEPARPVWTAILLSALGLNALTIGVYADALMGGSIAIDALAMVQREGEDPVFRFALGNAIEIPALLAVATVTAASMLYSSAPYIGLALVLNLGAAVVSQSRFVLIIAGYTLLRLWPRFGRAVQIAMGALLVGAVFSQGDALADTFESIAARFSGSDAGSAEDRAVIASIAIGQCDFSCLTFGNGIGSSMRAMEAAGEGYRSVENALLQLLFEIGFLGLVMLTVVLAHILRNARRRFHVSPEFLLVAVQALLLLPIFTFTPLYAFFAGALCASAMPRESKSAARPPLPVATVLASPPKPEA